MPINSRQKGKRGEREAAAFLRSIGFETARRTQQYNGEGKSDVTVDALPHVHIEIKFGYPIGRFDICTQLFRDAVAQAEGDANGNPWIILWKPLRYRTWRMSLREFGGKHVFTVSGDDAIKEMINRKASLCTSSCLIFSGS